MEQDMTKDEALDKALEALENNRRGHYYCEDIWYSCPKHEDGCANEAQGDKCNCGADKANQEIDRAITAIKQALAVPTVQEPVADVYMAGSMKTNIGTNGRVVYVSTVYSEKPLVKGDKFYTTPPAAQRQWVGLTEDEFEDIELGCRSTVSGKIMAMQKVEAKLKEKNT
jgi:hypothetical protein